jgi:hypothetical protein
MFIIIFLIQILFIIIQLIEIFRIIFTFLLKFLQSLESWLARNEKILPIFNLWRVFSFHLLLVFFFNYFNDFVSIDLY